MVTRLPDWNRQRPAADTEEYLTATQMERMLARLGCHNFFAIVVDMQEEGLPFAAEARMPAFQPHVGTNNGSVSGCNLGAPGFNVEKSIGPGAPNCQGGEYILPFAYADQAQSRGECHVSPITTASNCSSTDANSQACE